MPQITSFEHLKCPISHKLMVNPVIAADGYTYDFDAFKKAMQTNNVSPVTKNTLKHKQVMINKSIKELLERIGNMTTSNESPDTSDVTLVDDNSSGFFDAPDELPELQQLQQIEQLLSCPITGNLFTNPVIAADGYTYDQSALIERLSVNGNSPKTEKPFSHKHYLVNETMKQLVGEFQEKKKLLNQVELVESETDSFFDDLPPLSSMPPRQPPVSLDRQHQNQPMPPRSTQVQLFMSKEKAQRFKELPQAEQQQFVKAHFEDIQMQKQTLLSKLQRNDQVPSYLSQLENLELQLIKLPKQLGDLLVKALSHMNYPNLKIVILAGCHLGPDVMLSFASSALLKLQNLEQLILDENEMGDQSTKSLAQNILNLKELALLSLQNNGIGIEGALAILIAGNKISELRKQSNPDMKFHLNMSGNTVDREELDRRFNEITAQSRIHEL